MTGWRLTVGDMASISAIALTAVVGALVLYNEIVRMHHNCLPLESVLGMSVTS